MVRRGAVGLAGDQAVVLREGRQQRQVGLGAEGRQCRALHLLAEAFGDLLQGRPTLRVRAVHHRVGQRDAEGLGQHPPVVLGGGEVRAVVGAGQPDGAVVGDEGGVLPAGCEEVLGAARPAEEDVVVDIDEVVREVGHRVQAGLDRVRAEGRQRRGRQHVAVVDDPDAVIRGVEPRRHLSRGDEVDAPDPWCEEVEAAHRVAQLVAAAVARGTAGPSARRTAQSGDPRVAGSEPRLVVTVDPGVDDVDVEADVVHAQERHHLEGGDADALDLDGRAWRARRDAVAVAVEARRQQVTVGRLLPELDADLAALGQQAVVAAAHRPRLDEERCRTRARQVVGHRREGAASLVPAALGRVAHRQPVGGGAGGQGRQEVRAPRGRHDDHRVGVEAAGRQDEPALAGARGCRGHDLHCGRTCPGRRDAGGRGGLGQVAQRSGAQAVEHPPRRERVGPAGDGVAEDVDPLPGEIAGVPGDRAGERAGTEPRAEVTVGGDPQHGRCQRRLGPGRDEQAVDVVGDDLARTGRAVVGDGRHSGGHRFLQHQGVALAPRGEHGHARAGPLGGHVGGRAGELDPAVELELADLGGEVVGAWPVAPDPQRPARDLVLDPPEGVDEVLELLLGGQPAGGDEGQLVERRPRLRLLGERVGDHEELGRCAAEATGEPPRHRLGQRDDDVGTGGELQQRAHVVDPARGRAMLLVHEGDVSGCQLGDDRQQLGRRRDDDVGVETAEVLAQGRVGQPAEEGVPAAGDQGRLALRQLLGDLGGRLAADRGGSLTAYVDEVGDLQPVGQGVVGVRAAPGDAEDADPVALTEGEQGVGLGDPRARRAAHAVGVEEDEDDVERAVATGAAHRRSHLAAQAVAQCHVCLSPAVGGSGRHDPRALLRPIG